MKPDGSGEQLADRPARSDEGPSWAASGRELMFQRAGPDGRPGALPGVAGGRRPAPDDHSAGRLRPRLVGSARLMRRACSCSPCVSAAPRSAQLPGLPQACAARRRAPVLIGNRRAARRIRRAVGQRHRLFRRRQRGPRARRPGRLWRRRRMWLRQHPGTGRADRGPCRPQRHARSRAGGRCPARGGGARLSVLLGVPAAQLTATELGQGARRGDGLAPEALALNRRAVTVLVALGGAALVAGQRPATSAPGAGLRRFRERSFRARSRRGIPGRGCSPTAPRG